MKTIVSSLVGLLGVAFLSLISSLGALAQCNSQAVVYATSQNIPYCASGCTAVSMSINMGAGCTGLVGPFKMEAFGGIEIVGSDVPTRVGNVFSVSVRAKAGDICKGRLALRYWTTSDPCNDGSNYPVDNVRFIDVYKSGLTPTAVLNTMYANTPNLGSPTRIITQAPPCIKPNDVFVLSVLPVFQECSSALIGLDEIRWESVQPGFTEITRSADGSSITYRAPASGLAPSNEFRVFIGKATTTATATVTLQRSARFTAINTIAPVPSGLFTALNQSSTTAVATACIPINRGGAADQFTLACVPDEGTGTGITYEWIVENPNVIAIIGANTNRTCSFQVRNRNTANDLGSSGRITCITRSATQACGGSVAQFVISRGLLDDPFTPPTGPVEDYNAITVSPNPGQGPSGSSNCFTPGTNYTFTLRRAPLNTALTWANTFPANAPPANPTAPYWQIVNQPSQSQIVLTPVVPVNPTTLDIPLNVRTAAVCTGETIHYRINGAEPRAAGTNLAFQFFYDEPNNKVFLHGSNGGTFDANWPSKLPGGNGCGVNDFDFTWSFINGFGPGQNSTSSCSGACFFDELVNAQGNVQGQGANDVSVKNQMFTGTLRVTVRTRQASAPDCPSANCFFMTYEESFTNRQFRPSGGGGDPIGNDPNPAFARQGKEGNLVLSPNPAHHRVRIDLQDLDSGGEIRLLNLQGRSVRAVSDFQTGSDLDLTALPAGLYLLEYRQGSTWVKQSKLMVE